MYDSKALVAVTESYGFFLYEPRPIVYTVDGLLRREVWAHTWIWPWPIIKVKISVESGE